MTKKEIQQYVYDTLRYLGLPHIVVCAIMGNISAESNWDINAIESGSEIGFGLCQWSYGRRTQLEAYGTSLYHQVMFLYSELTGKNTDETGADYQWIADPSNAVDNGEGFYCSNDTFLNGGGDIDFLTKAFCYCWERPAYETNHLTWRKVEAVLFNMTMEYSYGPNPEQPVTTNNKPLSKLLLYFTGTR